jgi:hypothetical protein
MFACHIHDHPIRSPGVKRVQEKIITNEYIAGAA